MSDGCWEVLWNIGTLVAPHIIPSFTLGFILLQYFISKQKRKDDLFKIRYEFYEQVTKLMFEDIDNYGNCDDGRLSKRKFIYESRGQQLIHKAKFLFGNKMVDFLKKELSLNDIPLRSNLDNQFKKYLKLK